MGMRKQVRQVRIGPTAIQHVHGRSIRCARSHLLCLGLVSALVAAERAVAQTPPEDSSVSSRLTVRPREMATGTRNVPGLHPLDSLPKGSFVYVPQQCAGTRLVFLPGFPQEIRDWLSPVADKYGMILLVPAYGPAEWASDTNRTVVDVALKQTLRKFAIEPDKIAIVGRCASGSGADFLGNNNLDVFSRIVFISGSGLPLPERMDHRNKTTEFFVGAGYEESESEFEVVRELRRLGHSVKHVVNLRGHEHQAEDYDFMGRWLIESWATPDPSARSAPAVVADPLPVLTSEAVRQLTTAWTSFMREPDLIRMAGRRAHLREVLVPVGAERPSVWMTDMPALAAAYPSVAAALEQAGLTAQQHDAYRVALISARVAQSVGERAGPIEGTSTLAKNLAFLKSHSDELVPLDATGMWSTP